jgi:2-oxoglutarate ferredoxin oxidoreductase subunit gamma
VTLSQDSADGYAGLLRPDGILIYDSENVTRPPRFEGTGFGIPFTRLALEGTGQGETTPDVLALGAVVGITGVVSVGSLHKAVMGTMPPGTEETNSQALALGLALDPAEWWRSGTC